jgi:hypothetical protein
MVADDLPSERTRMSGSVVLGDARTSMPFVGGRKAQLCLFSPPYPNNIDYTEVYKLELWLLGLIETQAAFAEQRRQTVRSHPSLKFEDRYRYESLAFSSQVERILAPLLDAVPEGNRYTGARRRLIRGYADDLLASLTHIRARLSFGSPLVYVVGNSVHGVGNETFVIAADVLIAALAELAGFSIDRVEIARRPRRRRVASPFLRESVVFARAVRLPESHVARNGDRLHG